MVGCLAGVAVVGDIVITPLSYTDLRDSKRRPVLVVADVGMQDWVVCQITSHSPGRPGELEITQRDMQAGGIDSDSWVRPDRLFTLDERLFTPPVARVAGYKLAEVLGVIRGLF